MDGGMGGLTHARSALHSVESMNVYDRCRVVGLTREGLTQGRTCVHVCGGSPLKVVCNCCTVER